MRNGIYLSVDLDAFNLEDFADTAEAILQRVAECPRVPIVMSHERLLPRIDCSTTRELWNVDYHSDLPEIAQEPSPHNGTWGAHVRWRRKGVFVWVHPHGARWNEPGLGRCDSLSNYGSDREDLNPFKNASAHEWRRVRARQITTRIPWHRVVDVGVSVSPDYTDPSQLRRIAQRNPKIQRWLSDNQVFQRASAWSCRKFPLSKLGDTWHYYTRKETP